MAGNPESRTDPAGQKYECPDGCGSGNGSSSGGGDNGGCGGRTKAGADSCGKTDPCASGPKSDNQCTYSSGECNGHTYNQCKSWESDAKAARDKQLADLKNQATWEGIGAGVAGILLGFFQFQAGKGLLAKLMAALTIINSITDLLVLFQSVLGGSTYQVLATVVSALQAGTGFIRSAMGMIKGAAGWAAEWADMAAEGAIAFVGSPLSVLSRLVVGFVAAGASQFLNAGVSFLQAKATWDQADYQKQEDMTIQDWCAQNAGCPSISTYTG